MNIILFNPKSRNGKNPKFVSKIKKKIKKSHQAVVSKSILEIDHIDAFLNELDDNDCLILVGGDGTLHQLVNKVDIKCIKQPLYMIKGGTGNDFLRSIHAKNFLIPISTHLVSLPKATIQNKDVSFINGVGLGLDGVVGNILVEEHAKKSSFSYLKATLKGFVRHQPSSMTLSLNENILTYDSIWMISVMYGNKFGGGMRIAPQANRDEWLHVVVVKDCPKWLLFLIFPLIYIGKHVWFKKYVHIHQTKHISISSELPIDGEIDGELLKNVKKLEVKR